MDGVLIRMSPDTIHIGDVDVSVPGLTSFAVSRNQLFWLQKLDGTTIFHVRQAETTNTTSIPLLGTFGVTGIYPGVDWVWMNTRTGLQRFQYPEHGSDGSSVSDYLISHRTEDIRVIDGAADPGGGLWVAEQSKVMLLKDDTTTTLSWPQPGLVQRLMVARNQLWILTLSGRLVGIDLSENAVTADLTLPGPGIAVASAEDGFYVALGVLDDPAGRTIAIHRIGNDGSVQWTSDSIASCRSGECRGLVANGNRVIYGGSGEFVTLDASTGQVLTGE